MCHVCVTRLSRPLVILVRSAYPLEGETRCCVKEKNHKINHGMTELEHAAVPVSRSSCICAAAGADYANLTLLLLPS